MTAGVGAPGLVPDGFRLGRLLGRGGSGTVHEARHAATGRALALKMLTVDVADSAALRLFERERTVMAELATHPNVVSIVDAGVLGGRPWIAIDLCRRGSLAGSGPLPVDAVATTIRAIAEALTAAHARGVIHCDVKPANILVTDYGQVALGDFGVARLALGSGTGATAGGYTLDHVAPEVVDGARPTDRADVYSLGTTAWQLLCGRPPFRRLGDTSAGAIMARIRSEPLPPLDRPDVPGPLAALIARMTAKAPGARPSAPEVAAAVDRVAWTHGLSLSAPMGGALSPDEDITDLTPVHGPPSHPPFHPPSAPGLTDHRPDLAGLTHGGRPAALAAAPPVLASAEPVRRRDPVVLAAVVAVCVVVVACAGFVTARLVPSGAAAAVVTTATGEQQVVPAGVTPPEASVPLEASGDPALVSADRPSSSSLGGRAPARPGAPAAAAAAPVAAKPVVPPPAVTTAEKAPIKVRLWIQKDCGGPNVSQCYRSVGVPTVFTKVSADDGAMWNNCTEHVVVDGPRNVNYVDVTTACNADQERSVGSSVELGNYTATITVQVDGQSLGPQRAYFEVIE